MRRSFPVIFGAARCAAELDRALTRSTDALRETAAGFLFDALDPDERAELTTALYEARLGSVRDFVPRWEAEMFEAELPKPPARVLVGGAGAGRECLWLAERGFEIGAFDPGRKAIEACGRIVGVSGHAAIGTYEELAFAALDGKQNSLTGIAAMRWDAVLCGWTSIMHVTSDVARARLLPTLRGVCPSGPILLTYYRANRERPRGRAYRWARHAGRWVARSRALSSTNDPAANGDAFGFACGFLRGWSDDELAAHAAAIGARLHVLGESEGCVRAVLR